tara:strand:- start:1351 stop:1512 length:162 start_codon:yes stop_codon:yes gene_type:complete
MIVIDFIYSILVLWTGIVVAWPSDEGETKPLITHLMAAVLIMVSIKNLILMIL